jgi:hypothetical protein
MSMTSDEAHALKRGVAAGASAPGIAAAAAVKTWHCTTFPSCTAAANFLNLPPAQVAGEAFASDDDHGNIILFWFL